ncbi:hypothetical protein [Dyella flagellata]|uniref:Uncharacterized protein n=1 Tax=Dyella flagellata TaxID=1867833 RepID=A0ABQ5XC30_9GAMM|nr:hypothetical protein [Dyella flagellata]GLQ88517.1 hypothetical protein GCM10007898_20870 [Dyella flagellata]
MKTPFMASALVLVAAALGYTPYAAAQDTNLASASMTVCATSGTVTLTVLGVTQVLPINCQGSATISVPGTTQKVSANLNVGLLGMNVMSLAGTTATAQETIGVDSTSLSGSVQSGTLSFLNSAVMIGNTTAALSCNARALSTTLQCQSSLGNASVSVDGLPISLPNPIPINYTIPVSNISVNVDTPLGQVSIATSGTLTLNGVVANGLNTPNITVAQLGERLQVSGGTTVLGLGLVSVAVDATNSNSASVQTTSSSPVFTNVTFQ